VPAGSRWNWRELGLARFWAERLDPSRKGTRWDQVLLGNLCKSHWPMIAL
jgi:hypothetical protein